MGIVFRYYGFIDFYRIFSMFATALLAALSLILYGFVYTPLKRVGPIAVFVGAIPGAFPPMIGWIAATNQFGSGARNFVCDSVFLAISSFLGHCLGTGRRL